MLLLMACSSAQQAVHAVLDARTQALDARNIGAYEALLADDYRDGRRDKSVVVAEMKALFQQFDAIQMHIHSQEVRVLDDGIAQCEQSYTLKVQKDGVWRNVTRREQLVLRQESGHWLIVSGL